MVRFWTIPDGYQTELCGLRLCKGAQGGPRLEDELGELLGALLVPVQLAEADEGGLDVLDGGLAGGGAAGEDGLVYLLRAGRVCGGQLLRLGEPAGIFGGGHRHLCGR